MKKTSTNQEAPSEAAITRGAGGVAAGGASSGASPTGSAEKREDVVLLAGPTPDQRGVMVLRKRGERVELGEVRPLEQGKSLGGDLVKLVPRAGQPRVCDVETTFSVEERLSATRGAARESDRMVTRRAHHGPPQVATQRYRDNWASIYERRGPIDPADLN